MTKFIDRNWAKWEENIAPIIATAAEEAVSMGRRRTVKMNDEDPDEEQKSNQREPAKQHSGPFALGAQGS